MQPRLDEPHTTHGQANDFTVITENELQKQIILLQQTVSK
jgi:hypothetical protein